MIGWLIRVGDAVSQFFNVLLLNGEANESISGRCYRELWIRAECFIDRLASPWESDHCKKAFENDLNRAKELVHNCTKHDRFNG